MGGHASIARMPRLRLFPRAAARAPPAATRLPRRRACDELAPFHRFPMHFVSTQAIKTGKSVERNGGGVMPQRPLRESRAAYVSIGFRLAAEVAIRRRQFDPQLRTAAEAKRNGEECPEVIDIERTLRLPA